MSNRNYIVLGDGKGLEISDTDPYEEPSVRDWDQLLHQTLSQIFRERCLTSEQIKELFSVPNKERANKNFIFQLILKREPALGKLLLKRKQFSFMWMTILSCYQNSAELLMLAGADVNERLNEHYYGFNCSAKLNMKSTLLHALVKMYPSAWNERFIGLLIENGNDVKAPDNEGCTSLHLAVKNGRVKIAEMLLERGADVNAVSWFSMTPLLNAAESKEAEELVPLLMRHGADVTVRDKSGRNVLHYLVTNINGEHVDLARVLIEKGASPRETNSNVLQSIHVAVYNNKIELVNLFLDHGANVNARAGEWSDQFPLEIAARNYEDPAMLRNLLKRGANIDLRNKYGETALHKLDGTHENTVAKLKLLLSVGANMFAETLVGITLFDVFRCKNMDNPCIRLMLKTLALKKACLQPSIKFKDERFIKRYPEQWSYYEGCLEEINRIKSTLINSCTFFDLLVQCPFHMIALIKNREFKKQFRQFDLSAFPLYAEDLLEAFNRAERYYQSILDQENLIDEAVYNALPHVVVRKVVSYIFKCKSCEFCELKKIVQASRSV